MINAASDRIYRPWVVVAILPHAKVRTIACFFNRQDADDRLRILRRFVPKAVFEVVFEPPATKE